MEFTLNDRINELDAAWHRVGQEIEELTKKRERIQREIDELVALRAQKTGDSNNG
jgi:prefoldin subunit 5